MKLLMLISELGYGGAEGAFQRLARHLSLAAEVEIAVFAERYNSAHYTHADTRLDLPIHRLDAPGREGRLARWKRRADGLATLRSTFRPDATISFLSGPNFLNVVSAGPGKRIVSIRGSRRFDAHAGPVANRIQQWTTDRIVSRRADAIIPVSRGLAGEIERSQPQARGKVRPIVGYVDAERLIAEAEMAVEPSFEALAGSPLIVAAGRQSPEKGFQHLIPAFASVRQRRSDARLVLIGDGPSRNDLFAMAGSLGLNAGERPDPGVDVIMPGFRERPHRYFRLGSAFALTSASEGFPNILVEALASGTRLIAADVPWGVREVFGLDPDPNGEPYPTHAAHSTKFGTLMPPIGPDGFRMQWADELGRTLDATRPSTADIADAQQQVRKFDCGLAASEWIAMIQNLEAGGKS